VKFYFNFGALITVALSAGSGHFTLVLIEDALRAPLTAFLT
jgi:hypothetical protein